jgi:hypothetical protein
MQRPLRELALPVIAAGCGLAVLVLPASTPVRLIAASALVLVLPGAALGRAVLPRGESVPEQILVALGASVVVVALVAIGLDAIGVALERTVWVIVLVLLTVVGSSVAILRDFRPSPRRLRLPAPPRPTDALLIAASVALIVGAVVLGTKPLSAPAGTPGSNALWVEDDGARGAAVVAQSSEFRTARFELSVTVDGRAVGALSTFKLAPGQRYRVPVPPNLPAGARVGALLYQVDQGTPRLTGRVELTVGTGGPLASAATKP